MILTRKKLFVVVNEVDNGRRFLAPVTCPVNRVDVNFVLKIHASTVSVWLTAMTIS